MNLAALFVILFHAGCVIGQSSHYTAVNNLKIAFQNNNPENLPDSTITVKVTYAMTSISNMDYDNGQVTFGGYFILTWTDPTFQWATSINNLFYKKTSLWTPVVAVDSGLNDVTILGRDDEILRVAKDGTIQWETGGVFTTHCDVSKTGARPDYMTCTLRLSSITYINAEVNLEHFSTTVDTTLLTSDIGSSLSSSSVDTVTLQDARKVYTKTYLRFQMKVKLDASVFTLPWVIVLVYLLLTSSHLFVFTATVEQIDRAGFSATILLASSVYLALIVSSISSMLPTVDRGVSHIEVCLTGLLFLIIVEIIADCFIMRIYKKETLGLVVTKSANDFAKSVLSKISLHFICYGQTNEDQPRKDEEAQAESKRTRARTKMPLKTRISPAVINSASRSTAQTDDSEAGFYRIKSAASAESRRRDSGPSIDFSSNDSDDHVTFTWSEIASMWSRVVLMLFFAVRCIVMCVCLVVILMNCEGSFCLI